MSMLLRFAAILIVVAWADPPATKKPTSKPAASQPTSKPSTKHKAKKKQKQKRTPTTREGEPTCMAELTAEEKSTMKTARYHVFMAKKETMQKFTCPTCKGSGKVHRVIRAPAPGGLAHVEDVDAVCPDCGGSAVLPSPGFHAALAKYNRKKLDWEHVYPWEAPLKTGLEPWLFLHVSNALIVRSLNADAYNRLRSGAIAVDDVFLMGVEAFNIDQREGRTVVQASLRMPGQYEGEINLMILFDKLPDAMHDNSCFVVFAYNEGPTAYQNIFGSTKTAQVLTGIGVKYVTRRDLGVAF